MRSRARRPFPSMMIATWRGAAPLRRSWASRSADVGAAAARGEDTGCGSSDFHDLGFLRLDHLVDPVDGVFVCLLELLLGMLLLVLGDAVQLLEHVAGVRARVADGDATLLGELVDHLHEVLAPLLVERGERDADDPSLRRRVEPEVGLADRLLDDLRLALVERRDDQRPRLG